MPYNDEMEGGKSEDREEEEQSRRERALVRMRMRTRKETLRETRYGKFLCAGFVFQGRYLRQHWGKTVRDS